MVRVHSKSIHRPLQGAPSPSVWNPCRAESNGLESSEVICLVFIQRNSPLGQHPAHRPRIGGRSGRQIGRKTCNLAEQAYRVYRDRLAHKLWHRSTSCFPPSTDSSAVVFSSDSPSSGPTFRPVYSSSSSTCSAAGAAAAGAAAAGGRALKTNRYCVTLQAL